MRSSPGAFCGDIDHILHPLRLAGSGIHGAELRKGPDLEIERVKAHLPDDLLSDMRALAAVRSRHHRRAKGPRSRRSLSACAQPRSPWSSPRSSTALNRHAGVFEILRGKKLFEIVPSRLVQGTALASLAKLPAFRNRVPIMIGDDIGDEAAFSVAESMKGFALRVAGEHYDDDRADLAGPARGRTAGSSSWPTGLPCSTKSSRDTSPLPARGLTPAANNKGLPDVSRQALGIRILKAWLVAVTAMAMVAVAMVMMPVPASDVEVHARAVAVVPVTAMGAAVAPLLAPVVAVAVAIRPVVNRLQIGAFGRHCVLHRPHRGRIGGASNLQRGRSHDGREDRRLQFIGTFLHIFPRDLHG